MKFVEVTMSDGSDRIIRINVSHIVSFGRTLDGRAWIETTIDHGDNAIQTQETFEQVDLMIAHDADAIASNRSATTGR